MNKPEFDPVNRPEHYANTTIEPIDVIEDWKLGFHLGNTVKYIKRAGLKGNLLQDLKKARWYLDRMIAILERALTRAETVTPPKPVKYSLQFKLELTDKRRQIYASPAKFSRVFDGDQEVPHMKVKSYGALLNAFTLTKPFARIFYGKERTLVRLNYVPKNELTGR